MKVQINGEQRETPEGLTVESLLNWLRLPVDRVAVERNRQLVLRREWAETPLQEGDSLEIVQLVGGGAPTTRIEERLIL